MRNARTALSTSRAAAAIAAAALVVSVCGVSPADAVRAVKRALNADAVDGLSASRAPRPGQLLALDGNARFPPSALPGNVRGPRGPEGPTGATGPGGVVGAAGPRGPVGPTGSAEAYIDRNNLSNDLPTAATTIIAEVRVPAGAYALDFSAHTYTSAPSTFVDCQLTTNGQQVVKTAALVGAAAEATVEAVLAMTEAVTLPETTVVRALCSERGSTDVQLTDARLRATRLTSVIEQ